MRGARTGLPFALSPEFELALKRVPACKQDYPRAKFSKMFSKIYGRILGKSFSKICGGRRQNFAADVFSKIFLFSS